MIFELISIIVLISGVLLIIKELSAYKKLKFYDKKEGQKVVYNPFIGFSRYLRNKEEKKELKELIVEESRKGTKLIAFNSYKNSSPVIILLDPQLRSEYFSQELKITKKCNFIDGLYFGSVDDSHQKLINKKNLLHTYFSKGNCIHFYPKMSKMVDTGIKNIRMGTLNSDQGSVNLEDQKSKDEKIRSLIFDCCYMFIFGDLCSEDSEGIEVNLGYLRLLVSIILDSKNKSTYFDIIHNLMTPYDNKTCYQGLFWIIKEINCYKTRRGKDDSDKNLVNFIDAKMDQLSIKDRWSEEEIISELIGTLISSYQLIKNIPIILRFLENDSKEYKSRYSKLKASQETDMGMMSKEHINLVEQLIYEVNSMDIQSMRQLTKSTKIGDYKLRKGDLIATTLLHELNTPNQQQVGPFSKGNRSCPGNYFSVMLISLIIESTL